MEEKSPEKPPKIIKGSVLEQDIEEIIDVPLYSDAEKTYISNLQKRLVSAKTIREQSYEEFDGMSYSEYVQSNEREANTAIKPRKNRSEVNYRSGTLRTKMMSFLSAFQGLNLKVDISAFRRDEVSLNVIGNAMEDIISKTEELENDEENKMLRQYELLKQGTVFLEELWDEKWEVEKNIVKGFYGKIEGVKWEPKRNKNQGSPKRRIIPNLSVYLGDISKYMIDNQPYIFTIENKNRNETEQIYGGWERWKYVSKKKGSFSETEDAMKNNDWRLLSNTEQDEVEIIKYQDKPNNEFQIIINGVLMLPMGYPFPWGHGDYSIVQQNLEPIKHNFAYGKSFIFKNKNLVILFDELTKLAVLKTQKSLMPPYLNVSGRVISKKVFMPAQITMGIPAGSLVPVSEQEVKGVTPGEFGMIQEVIRNIDSNTASQTFTGAKEQGAHPTATQIVELQRQARIMMGTMILATSLLEKKLSMKRIMIILQNWFNPLDTKLNEARTELKNRYRIVSRDRAIDTEGQGVRMTVISDEVMSSEDIMKGEDEMKEKFGKPFRVVVLNPKEIQMAKLTWVVNVTPKEKRSSEVSKLMFSAMVTDAMNMGLRIDPNYIEQRFAEVWDESSDKMFKTDRTEAGPVGTEETSVAGNPATKSENAPNNASKVKIGVGGMPGGRSAISSSEVLK